jgi:hypothetical protein
VLIGRAAGCGLKERRCLKNIDGNGDSGFDKRLLAFVEFTGNSSRCYTSTFFVDDIVLLCQILPASSSHGQSIYVLERLHGNQNFGPRAASTEY